VLLVDEPQEAKNMESTMDDNTTVLIIENLIIRDLFINNNI